MRSVAVILLHALVVQALANAQANQGQKSLIDNLIDTLVDKLVGRLVSVPGALTYAQSGSMLRGAQSPFVSRTRAPTYSLASLPGDPQLKSLLANQIRKVNRGCQVSAATTALAYNEIAANKTYSKLMYGASDAMEPMSEAKVKEMAGITAPMGLWDPLGISTKVPEGQLLFYREAELKHGRVCMLAVLGLIVGEAHAFIPLLGEGIPADVPAFELGGPYITETPAKDFWYIAIGALFAEEARHEYYRKANPAVAPGDYGWDPLGMKPKTDKELKELQNKELNNGRLAMFAAAGIIAQEMATGKKIFF